MVIKESFQANRKAVKEDRIAICPQFGCSHLEKIKPLKLGFIGLRKYPKCSKHQYPLVFVDHFIENFLRAIRACIYDKSSLPPEKLITIIKAVAPDDLKAFINGWIYCNPIGRGAQIVSQYMEGLSRGYIKLLSRKQRKIYKKSSNSKPNNMLRKGLERIGEEYAAFLKLVNEKSDIFCDPKNLHPLSHNTLKYLKVWLYDQMDDIQNATTKKTNEMCEKDEFLSILKQKYDKILQAGTGACLIGKSPTIVTKTISVFELFSAYYEFLDSGLSKELRKDDIDMILNQDQKIFELNEKVLIDEKQKNKNSVPINIFIFEQKVLSEIEKIILLLGTTEVQRSVILEKSKELLMSHISRAENKLISIPKNANPLTNAAAIVYTVLMSNNNLPDVRGVELYKLVGVSKSPFYVQYKNYKSLLPQPNFDFNSAHLGKVRRNVSLYFFKILMNPKIILSELNSLLNEVSTSNLVLRFREIILKNDNLTRQEQYLIKLVNERKSVLQDMAINYSETFEKYFSDLVKMIKYLILSVKSHKTIHVDFSARHFSMFLMKEGINLYNKQGTLEKVILDIFDFLRSKFPDLFPEKTKTGDSWGSKIGDKGQVRKRVVGSRIKLYIMKNIYEGKYFDKDNEISICPECLDEDFIINTSFPRIRSKEFHHKKLKIEGYSVNELYDLFLRDRGNPYFLRDLIRRMEEESVVLSCGSHHSIIKAIHFKNFKKLISWENIPRDFGYEDIFDLPAKIINSLVKICVDNYILADPLPGRKIVREPNIKERRRNVRKYILEFLKKRYIIDRIYNGFCPVCREFNTRDHLPVFEYNHLFKKNELTLENKERRERYRITTLYQTLPPSQIVKEMEKIYHKGGYLCCNCHRNFHKDLSILDKIYDDKMILRKVQKDNERTRKLFKQNLVYYKKSINIPLKSQNIRYDTFVEYLIALYEISMHKGEQEGVTRKEIQNFLGFGTYSYSFEKKDIFNKYIRIVKEKPVRYYITNEGKQIVRLIYYFRDYYRSVIVG